MLLFCSVSLLGDEELFSVPDPGRLKKGIVEELEKKELLVRAVTEEDGGTLIQALYLMDYVPEDVFPYLYRTEDQATFISSLKESRVIRKSRDSDCIHYIAAFLFLRKEYRIVHSFDWNNHHIFWNLDPSFDNEIEQTAGDWWLFSFPGKRTLVFYQARIVIRGVPRLLEKQIQKGESRKILKAIGQYIIDKNQ